MTTNWKVKPERSKSYREYINSLPCVACGYSDQLSAAHHEQLPGHGGRGTKCDDTRCLPLCVVCHDYRHTRGRGVWQEWNIDPVAIIQRLQKDYIKSVRMKGKP